MNLMMICFTAGESDNRKFRALRDEVVIDALTYHKLVVPKVTEALEQAKELFSLFDEKGY